MDTGETFAIKRVTKVVIVLAHKTPDIVMGVQINRCMDLYAINGVVHLV